MAVRYTRCHGVRRALQRLGIGLLTALVAASSAVAQQLGSGAAPSQAPLAPQFGNPPFNSPQFNSPYGSPYGYNNSWQAMAQQAAQQGALFLQFLIDAPLSQYELQTIQQEVASDFAENPQKALQDSQQIRQMMGQIGAINDPLQRQVVRKALYNEIYLASLTDAEIQRSPSINLVWQRIPVLAVDMAHQLVLSQTDIDGALAFFAFLFQLAGQPVQFDGPMYQQLSQTIAQQFPTLPLEQKQLYALGSIFWPAFQQGWQQLPAPQQQQIRGQLSTAVQQQTQQWLQSQRLSRAQLPWSQPSPLPSPDGGQAPPRFGAGQLEESAAQTPPISQQFEALQQQQQQMAYQIMSNMMSQQHVTMMNIIENIGAQGGYWEWRPE